MSSEPVVLQSVLSLSSSAFLQSTSFLAKLFCISFFCSFKNSFFESKNLSHAALKRSNILLFIWRGVKPMLFHSSCNASTASVSLLQALKLSSTERSIASIFSQIAAFSSKFLVCCSLSISKWSWCFLLITVEASLKRSQMLSLSSLETGPISRHCW